MTHLGGIENLLADSEIRQENLSSRMTNLTGPVNFENLMMSPHAGTHKDVDISSWFVDFINISQALEWGEQKKLNMLSLLMKGTAQLELQTIRDEREDAITRANAHNLLPANQANLVQVPGPLTFQEAREALTLRLTVVGSARLIQSQFNRKAQKPGEEVGPFAFELLRLCKLGWPALQKNDWEAMVVQRLCESALPQYRSYLVTQEFPTLLQLLESVEVGIEAEVNMLNSENQDNSDLPWQVQFEQMKLNLKALEDKLDEQNQGPSSSQNCPPGNFELGRCFRC